MCGFIVCRAVVCFPSDACLPAQWVVASRPIPGGAAVQPVSNPKRCDCPRCPRCCLQSDGPVTLEETAPRRKKKGTDSRLPPDNTTTNPFADLAIILPTHSRRIWQFLEEVV